VRLDTRWIVPHNLELLKKYDAHINTEWCNKSIFIKYIFKYVTKGPDCSKAYLQKITDVKILQWMKNLIQEMKSRST
jgi:hypothetical protein